MSSISRIARAVRSSWTVIAHTIVTRTTLMIVVLSVCVGIVFAAASSLRIQQHESEKLDERLEALISTVSNTVSAAAFVRDPLLAKEVTEGLLRNREIAGVRITTGGELLFEKSRPEAFPNARDPDVIVMSRPVPSPFNRSESIGEISLFVSGTQMRAQAWEYTRFTLLILALEVALVAAGVAAVVYALVTRPIKGVSDALHRLELRGGMRLQVPRSNESDEIGRLVVDVNGLISRLEDLLDERELARAAAVDAASHDTLTGLLNRRGLDAKLESHALPVVLAGERIAAMQIDLDFFKQVNDTHGHAAGDIVLRSAARVLRSVVGRQDLVARQGGDEFLILLTDPASVLRAEQIAVQLIDALGEPIDIGNGHEARISASVGIAFNAGRERPEAILRRADAAMYSAKQSGRSRYCVASLPRTPDPSSLAAA